MQSRNGLELRLRASVVLMALVGTLGLALGASAMYPNVALGAPSSAPRSQNSASLQPISVRVAFNLAATPSGVSGYRVEALCNNVPLSAGQYRVSLQFPVQGGTGALLVPLTTGVSCSFRLTVLGSGPRPLSGSGALVGGTLRPVIFPTTVDGVPVDPNTVVETGQIPVEVPTGVVFGDSASLTSTTTTTSATTTIPATTSTTIPATTSTTRPITTTTSTTSTVPPTSRPTSVVTVIPPTKAPVKTRLVRVCTKRVRGKCVATKLVRR